MTPEQGLTLLHAAEYVATIFVMMIPVCLYFIIKEVFK